MFYVLFKNKNREPVAIPVTADVTREEVEEAIEKAFRPAFDHVELLEEEDIPEGVKKAKIF